MKEDDICELLKFERKQIRARISLLRMDKFLQVRLKMETGPDGKAAKVNYYYINYKTFVNVVKYKLDLMRKRMETEERDATSRASFLCPNCRKTFTDLEADQLCDMVTGEFHCTFCGSPVEEDTSAMPKKDSRLLLAKFNEQLQPLYDLLREVEDIKLSPECLEPEPTDLDTIRGLNKHFGMRNSNEPWSGEATRNQGFAVEETRVDVNLDGDELPEAVRPKDRPVWMTESTVVSTSAAADGNGLAVTDSNDSILHKAAVSSTAHSSGGRGGRKDNGEDIMSVLLQHEKQTGKTNASQTAVRGLTSGGGGGGGNSSDSSDDENIENAVIRKNCEHNFIHFHLILLLLFAHFLVLADVDVMESEEEDDDSPTVLVAGRPVAIDELTAELIEQMTQQEKYTYIQVYQDHFSHMHD